MSNSVLTKYRTIRPVNDIDATNSLLSILVEIANEQQNRFWVRSEVTGAVCLFKHDSHPSRVLEYVQGSKDDSVTTLYEENSFMTDCGQLSRVREELINEIGIVLMALPSTVAVHDGGRDRQAMLKELGTAQLMDVLAHFTNTDIRGV